MVEGFKNKTQFELSPSKSLNEVSPNSRFLIDSSSEAKSKQNAKETSGCSGGRLNQTKSEVIKFESGCNADVLDNEFRMLQKRIEDISSKLEENLAVLKEKQLKNANIRKFLEDRELVSTGPTEVTYDESACSCKNKCSLF